MVRHKHTSILHKPEVMRLSELRSFGPQIKARRQALGMPVVRAAKLLGISRSRLSEIERGVSYNTGHATRPARELVEKMAAVYGIERDLLLMAAGYPTAAPIDLTPAARDLLFMFEQLPPGGQEVALGMLRVLIESRAPYGADSSSR